MLPKSEVPITAENDGFANLEIKMRFVAIEDDNLAPYPSVEALQGFYESAKTELEELKLNDYGLISLGHFGFFKKQHREALWPLIFKWLSW